MFKRGRDWLKNNPGPVKEWLISLAAIITLVIIFGYTDRKLIWGIILGLFRGEVALIYLMKIGFSRIQAIGFVTLWSSINIYNYWWASNQLEDPVRNFILKFAKRIRKILGVAPISVKKRIAATPPTDQTKMIKKAVGKLPYFLLPLYCFDPIFGVTSGIIFAKTLKLSKWPVIIILLGANFLEKALWCIFLHAMMPYINYVVLPIIFLALGTVLIIGIFRLIYFGGDQT